MVKQRHASPMSLFSTSAALVRMGPVEAPPPPVKPRQPVQKPGPQTRPLQAPPEPLWNVILLDDDFHTFSYVITMLGDIFGHPPDKAFIMAQSAPSSKAP
jgi:hypothetical protein